MTNSITMPTLNVYRASAGSGKTFTLAAHYVALLMQGVAPGSILCMTFTNKATAEMKGRILDYLYRIASGEESDDMRSFLDTVRTLCPDRVLEGKKMQTMARLQLKALLDDYDHFGVTTIDSFMQRLVGEVALKAGLRTDYRVELRDADVINEAVDELMTHLQSIDKAAFEDIKNMIQEALEDESSWDIRKRLVGLGKQLYNQDYLKGRKDIEKYISDHKTFDEYRRNLKKFLDENKTDLQDKINEYKEKFENRWTSGNKNHERWVNGFVSRINAYLKEENVVHSGYYGLPSSMINILNGDAKFWSTFKGSYCVGDFAGLILAMNDKGKVFYELLTSVRESKRQLYGLSLLHTVSEKVNSINHDRNRMLLAMTPILLQNILAKGDETMFVLERAGIRYSHVMIDEFQDTSFSQWKNILPLLEEVLSRGGTTLIVGDVKQSIYRWRGGDWEILKDIENDEGLHRYFATEQGVVNNLKKNFRSNRNIVDFNLNFFPLAAAKLDEKAKSLPTKEWKAEQKEIENIYNEKFEKEKLSEFCKKMETDGRVDIKVYPYKKEEKEVVVDKLVGEMFLQIDNLLNGGLEQRDLLILVRGHKEIAEVTHYLDLHREDYQNNLVLSGPDAYYLKSSLSVQILIQALRYLYREADEIALAFFLRHYQKDILGNDKPIYELMENSERWLPKEWNREMLLGLPLYEMVEQLRRILLFNKEGKAVLNDESFVFSFMDRLLTYISEEGTDLGKFLDYWDETLNEKTIDVPLNDDGISILTIHKAKGLERHTVLLPLCDWDIEKDASGGFQSKGGMSSFIWCTPPEQPFNQLPWIPVAPRKSLSESIYKDAYAKEHEYQRIDNLNLLYVAFTRAKKNLLVYSRYMYKEDKNGKIEDREVETVGDLIAECLNVKKGIKPDGKQGFIQAYEAGTLVTEREVETEFVNRLSPKKENVTVGMSRQKEKLCFKQSNESENFISPLLDEEEETKKEYVRQGNLCHLLFSAIRVTEDAENVIQKFLQKGVIESEVKAQELRRLVSHCWENPQAKAWFDSSWALFRECNILTRDEHGKMVEERPDRVMMRGEKTIVVDFKFGHPSMKFRDLYTNQVRRYMNLLKRMGRKDVKGYIWYVFNDEIAEVNL